MASAPLSSLALELSTPLFRVGSTATAAVPGSKLGNSFLGPNLRYCHGMADPR